MAMVGSRNGVNERDTQPFADQRADRRRETQSTREIHRTPTAAREGAG